MGLNYNSLHYCSEERDKIVSAVNLRGCIANRSDGDLMEKLRGCYIIFYKSTRYITLVLIISICLYLQQIYNTIRLGAHQIHTGPEIHNCVVYLRVVLHV